FRRSRRSSSRDHHATLRQRLKDRIPPGRGRDPNDADALRSRGCGRPADYLDCCGGRRSVITGGSRTSREDRLFLLSASDSRCGTHPSCPCCPAPWYSARRTYELDPDTAALLGRALFGVLLNPLARRHAHQECKAAI